MRGLICGALLSASTLLAQDTGHRHTDPQAFLREVGAGAVGSFAGFIPVMLVPSCFKATHYSETIDCHEPLVVGAFVVSPVGASLGVTLAARHHRTPRHALGAWVGGVAGGVAGIAIANVMDRAGAGPGLTFPTFYLTQATMSALGSRFAGRLADHRVSAPRDPSRPGTAIRR